MQSSVYTADPLILETSTSRKKLLERNTNWSLETFELTEMGCRNRDLFSEDSSSSSSSSLSDALLFATMCIIGLPVDVHVKDGSVYSGIFHTASVDKDYGAFLFDCAVSFSLINFFQFFFSENRVRL